MIYAAIASGVLGLLLGLVSGYFIGRHETSLLDKIRTLETQRKEEKPPEPIKPVVTGGAYQPPKPISTVPEPKQKAGIVETKTPELLDWENKQEIDNLA